MYVLGIAGGFGHDASACLLEDGVLLAFAEEERLTRNKVAFAQPPIRSVLACCRRAGVDITDVEVVAYGWDPTLDPSLPTLSNTVNGLLQAPALRPLAHKTAYYVPHHDAHAAMAVAGAEGNVGSVLVLDGRGESSCVTAYKVEGGRCVPIFSLDVVESLGSFYSAATRFAGFSRGGEGSLMGLAAFGDTRRVPNVPAYTGDAWDDLRANIKVERGRGDRTERHSRVRAAWFEVFEETFADVQKGSAAGRADFALWVQREFTAAVQLLALETLRLSGSASLALSGGVALNCAANGELRRLLGRNLHLHALVGDAGTSLGAASHLIGQGGRALHVDHAYLGHAYSDADIVGLLNNHKLTYNAPPHIERRVAELLEQGKLVGWFQGGSEAGPRALGHRSILASATRPGIRRALNALKQREPWRPVAPSTLESAASQLYDVESSPYMIEASHATTAAVAFVPETVHADGTVRVHTASRHTDVRFRELLQVLEGQTGLGVVCNTSFNVGPEPIVESPTDAVRTFFGSPLDALAIGPALLLK